MADTLRPMPGVAAAAIEGDARPFSQTIYSWLLSLNNAVRRTSRITYAAANPTTSDIADGEVRVWKNTTLGEVRLWANDGGTLRSVQLT